MIAPLLFLSLLGGPAPDRDRPFNKVALPESNMVTVSAELPAWYDTVIKVGLERAGVRGRELVVLPIGEVLAADGVLAHVRDLEGRYYLFISSLGRAEAIEVVGHEAWHVRQYESGMLGYDPAAGVVRWDGEDYPADRIPYDERPWERDAFDRGPGVAAGIERELW